MLRQTKSTQVYPLALIRRRNGNWLHRGSSPLTWTNKLISDATVMKLVNIGDLDKHFYTYNMKSTITDEEFIEIVKKCATMAQAAKMCRNGF